MTTLAFDIQREEMVRTQLVARGIVDPLVVAAMGAVPREDFVGARYHEFAYEDAPLPIEDGQVIPQPYLVALMIESAHVRPGMRVMEIGSGAGYGAAVLARIAGEVHAVEWHRQLARISRECLDRLGCRNVTVHHAEGADGCPANAPYDAIIVAAGGHEIPKTLLEQLRVGGTLVMPLGHEPRTQELVRIRRVGNARYERESLGKVRWVPLIGAEGWAADGQALVPARAIPPLRAISRSRRQLTTAIARACEPIRDPDTDSLEPLLARIGDARVVLIGESTHGTSEFYRFRARITRELIQKRGFTVVALEADWPDIAVLDRHVQGLASTTECRHAFDRFPSWMWRNRETAEFVDWLSAQRLRTGPGAQCPRLYGLDLYSLSKSIAAVLAFLDHEDPTAAALARERYGCFSPWEADPATYGRATSAGRLEGCERQAVGMLRELLEMRLTDPLRTRDPLFDAQRNAAVVREAERYYRAMYYGARESWNLRDRHMLQTLQAIMLHRGDDARAVVWAHNSHVGDAAATEMAARGETSLGSLVRASFGPLSYLIGMGTDRGTVAAARQWDGPMEIRAVRPSHAESYESLCHESGVPAFLLPMRAARDPALRDALAVPRLERAIGVIYRPETELLSHYMQASLTGQFDEWAWFDQTHAVDAQSDTTEDQAPGTYPFGL